MEKVIQASQNDFEESGVDQSTLEEMKQVRCNLASILAVAPFLASVAAWQPSRLCPYATASMVSPQLIFIGYLVASFLPLAATMARWLPGFGG